MLSFSWLWPILLPLTLQSPREFTIQFQSISLHWLCLNQTTDQLKPFIFKWLIEFYCKLLRVGYRIACWLAVVGVCRFLWKSGFFCFFCCDGFWRFFVGPACKFLNFYTTSNLKFDLTFLLVLILKLTY